MQKRNGEYIQFITLDRLLLNDVVVMQVTDRGAESVRYVKHSIADEMEKMLQSAGYQKTRFTTTIAIWSRVSRKGKVYV